MTKTPKAIERAELSMARALVIKDAKEARACALDAISAARKAGRSWIVNQDLRVEPCAVGAVIVDDKRGARYALQYDSSAANYVVTIIEAFPPRGIARTILSA